MLRSTTTFVAAVAAFTLLVPAAQADTSAQCALSVKLKHNAGQGPGPRLFNCKGTLADAATLADGSVSVMRGARWRGTCTKGTATLPIRGYVPVLFGFAEVEGTLHVQRLGSYWNLHGFATVKRSAFLGNGSEEGVEIGGVGTYVYTLPNECEQGGKLDAQLTVLSITRKLNRRLAKKPLTVR